MGRQTCQEEKPDMTTYSPQASSLRCTAYSFAGPAGCNWGKPRAEREKQPPGEGAPPVGSYSLKDSWEELATKKVAYGSKFEKLVTEARVAPVAVAMLKRSMRSHFSAPSLSGEERGGRHISPSPRSRERGPSATSEAPRTCKNHYMS